MPPPSPDPRPPPPPGRRRGALAAALALAIVAAFLAGFLVPRGGAEEDAFDRSRFDADGRYGPYFHGPIVIVDIDAYYEYLNVSVRPALLTVSVSLTGAACGAIAQEEDDGVVERLLQAKEAARHAVDENLRVSPPPQFERLHKAVRDVFEHTTSTADALVGCVRSGDVDCPEAQADLVALLDDSGDLTREVKALVTASPSVGL